MGLILVRVDDRLIHGQVMVGWRTFLGATQILVASDRLASNPTACSILDLTAPPDVRLVIDTVDNMARRVREGEFDREKDILLFENLNDILRALDLGMTFAHLNIGGIRHHDCCVAFTPSVSLSDHDIQMLREIMGRGIPIDIQMVPMEKAVHLAPDMLDRRVRG